MGEDLGVSDASDQINRHFGAAANEAVTFQIEAGAVREEASSRAVSARIGDSARRIWESGPRDGSRHGRDIAAGQYDDEVWNADAAASTKGEVVSLRSRS